MSNVNVTKRRYTDTVHGQMHLTEAGSGPTIVLLHWVPLSGRLYDHELSAFADEGFHAVAVDLMGFGRSDKHDGVWTFEQHGAALSEGLKSAGIDQFALLGAHFSAPVSLEITRDPDLTVTSLIIDGCAHLLPEHALEGIAQRSHQLAGPGLHEDGSHRYYLWDQAINAYRIFDPDFVVRDDNVHLIYRFILDYLSTDPPRDFGSFAHYPTAERLAQVTCPTLVITAETDPLRPAYEPTLEACGGPTTGRIIEGAHPLHDDARRGEYAREIVRFLNEVSL